MGGGTSASIPPQNRLIPDKNGFILKLNGNQNQSDEDSVVTDPNQSNSPGKGSLIKQNSEKHNPKKAPSSRAMLISKASSKSLLATDKRPRWLLKEYRGGMRLEDLEIGRVIG